MISSDSNTRLQSSRMSGGVPKAMASSLKIGGWTGWVIIGALGQMVGERRRCVRTDHHRVGDELRRDLSRQRAGRGIGHRQHHDPGAGNRCFGGNATHAVGIIRALASGCGDPDMTRARNRRSADCGSGAAPFSSAPVRASLVAPGSSIVNWCDERFGLRLSVTEIARQSVRGDENVFGPDRSGPKRAGREGKAARTGAGRERRPPARAFRVESSAQNLSAAPSVTVRPGAQTGSIPPRLLLAA